MPHFKGMWSSSWGVASITSGRKSSLGPWNHTTLTLGYWASVWGQCGSHLPMPPSWPPRSAGFPLRRPSTLAAVMSRTLLTLSLGHLLPTAAEFPKLHIHGSLPPFPSSSAHQPCWRRARNPPSLPQLRPEADTLAPLLVMHLGWAIAFKQWLHLVDTSLSAPCGVLVSDVCRPTFVTEDRAPHNNSLPFSGTCLGSPYLSDLPH